MTSQTPVVKAMTSTHAWRVALIGAVVLAAGLPILGMAITHADPRFGNPCHQDASGAVEQTYPTPIAALVLCWLGVALAAAALAYGGWRQRVLITVFGAMLLLWNGLMLWTAYGMWVGTPDCGW